MEYIQLGKSGLNVSRICFGTWQFGGDWGSVERDDAIAAESGHTPAQLALAWLLHQGDDVAPIPGTRKVSRVEENAAAAGIELSDEQLATLEELFPPGVTAGDRYADMAAVEL